jgi:hypothetical protein
MRACFFIRIFYSRCFFYACFIFFVSRFFYKIFFIVRPLFPQICFPENRTRGFRRSGLLRWGFAQKGIRIRKGVFRRAMGLSHASCRVLF